MRTNNKTRIGITLGDCAGIGPEIVDLALNSNRLTRTAESKIVGKYPGSRPGNPTAETARAAAAALEEAVTLARRGELDAVVTGPVHKARMYEVGFKFPGQTEFFAERCGIKNFAMCLTGGKITVALVTVHLPLREAASALKQSEIVRVGLLLADFLDSRSDHRTAYRRCRIESACWGIRQIRLRRNRDYRAGSHGAKSINSHVAPITGRF